MKSLQAGHAPEMAAESAAVAAKVAMSRFWKEAGTVLLYASLPYEVDTSALLGTEGKRLVLPVVEGEVLRLREYRPGHLRTGYMGISEPDGDCPEVSPSEIDLAIVPGVAFDRAGNRLGKGKGFYDRLLPCLKCPVIGLAFSWQMTGHIPSEEHDAPLSLVISP